MPIILYPYRQHGCGRPLLKLSAVLIPVVAAVTVVKTDASGWLLGLCVISSGVALVFMAEGFRELLRRFIRLYADGERIEYGALLRQSIRWENITNANVERVLHVTGINPDGFRLDLIIETDSGRELAVPLYDAGFSPTADFSELFELVEEKMGLGGGFLGRELLDASKTGRGAARSYLATTGDTVIRGFGAIALSYLIASSIVSLENLWLFALVFVPLCAVSLRLVLYIKPVAVRNLDGTDTSEK